MRDVLTAAKGKSSLNNIEKNCYYASSALLMWYRCSWDGLGHWLVSHMAPWQPAMSGCDLGGAQTVTHCRLSHIHRVVPLLSPAEAHIALSPVTVFPQFLPLVLGIFISCGLEGRGRLALLLFFPLYSCDIIFITRDFRA